MSYHTAIVGQTGSGKSFLAQAVARGLSRDGARVVVYNPLLDPAWDNVGAAAVTDDPERALWYAEHNTGLCLFLEEVGTIPRDFDDRVRALACRGRHRGHRLWFLMQRGEQCPPIVRESCGFLFMFRNSRTGAKFWADSFGSDELLRAPQLPPRVCFYCAPCKPPKIITLKIK